MSKTSMTLRTVTYLRIAKLVQVLVVYRDGGVSLGFLPVRQQSGLPTGRKASHEARAARNLSRTARLFV